MEVGKREDALAETIDFPISIKKIKEVTNYLDTKVVHKQWEVMFEDAKHTRKFTDIHWGVLRMVVRLYHNTNGLMSAGKMHEIIKNLYMQTSQNKKGANIGSINKFQGGGVLNGNYLDTISNDKKDKILRNIANHYGISLSEAEVEVRDADAEMLYEYITNKELRMDVYNDFEYEKYAKGTTIEGDKPLSYYKYSTPRVNMAWNGVIQQGGFYSAEDCLNAIKKQAQTEEELTHYSIVTPDKVIHLGKEYQIRYSGGSKYAKGSTIEGNEFYVGQSIMLDDKLPHFRRMTKDIQRLVSPYYNKELVIEEIINNKPHNLAKAFVRSSGQKVPFEINLNKKIIQQYAKGSTIKGNENKFLQEVRRDAKSMSEQALRYTTKENKDVYAKTFVIERPKATQLSEKYSWCYQDEIDHIKSLGRENEFNVINTYEYGVEKHAKGSTKYAKGGSVNGFNYTIGGL